MSAAVVVVVVPPPWIGIYLTASDAIDGEVEGALVVVNVVWCGVRGA